MEASVIQGSIRESSRVSSLTLSLSEIVEKLRPQRYLEVCQTVKFISFICTPLQFHTLQCWFPLWVCGYNIEKRIYVIGYISQKGLKYFSWQSVVMKVPKQKYLVLCLSFWDVIVIFLPHMLTSATMMSFATRTLETTEYLGAADMRWSASMTVSRIKFSSLLHMFSCRRELWR